MGKILRKRIYFLLSSMSTRLVSNKNWESRESLVLLKLKVFFFAPSLPLSFLPSLSLLIFLPLSSSLPSFLHSFNLSPSPLIHSTHYLAPSPHTLHFLQSKFEVAQELCQRCLSNDNSCSQAWEILGLVKEKDMDYPHAAGRIQPSLFLSFFLSHTPFFFLSTYLSISLSIFLSFFSLFLSLFLYHFHIFYHFFQHSLAYFVTLAALYSFT